jgi:flagellar FliL protein
MKYIMILLMAVCLLGAGGAAGFFAFQKQAVASLGAENATALAAKKARDKAALGAEEIAKNLRFVKLDPIILPIIDTQGVSQVVTLIVSLEVDSEEKAKRAELLIPRLKDAFIQDMYGVLNRKAATSGGLVKVDQLKARLNRISIKVLGKGNINSVLLQVVNQREI